LARKFDIDKLQDTHVTELFKVRIRGAFDSLLQLNTSIDSLYESFKSTINTVSKEKETSEWYEESCVKKGEIPG